MYEIVAMSEKEGKMAWGDVRSGGGKGLVWWMRERERESGSEMGLKVIREEKGDGEHKGEVLGPL